MMQGYAIDEDKHTRTQKKVHTCLYFDKKSILKLIRILSFS